MSDGDEITHDSGYSNDSSSQPTVQQKLTKNQKRKLRNKKKKLERKAISREREDETRSTTDQESHAEEENDENIEIEYVPEKLEIKDSSLSSYVKVFERFSVDTNGILNDKNQNENDDEVKKRLLERKKPQEFEVKEEENESDESKISKRKLKQVRLAFKARSSERIK